MSVDIKKLEALAKAATPGPWVIRHGDGWYNKHSYEIEASNESHVAETLYAYNGEADAAYITHACNAVPELIEYVRELEAELKQTVNEKMEMWENVRKLAYQRDWLAAWISHNVVGTKEYWIKRATKEAGE